MARKLSAEQISLLQSIAEEPGFCGVCWEQRGRAHRLLLRGLLERRGDATLAHWEWRATDAGRALLAELEAKP